MAGGASRRIIVCDHGTEFTSNAMLAWAEEARVDWHFIAPGKPMQNGICESFNGRMRDELLNETLFFGPRSRPLGAGTLGHRLQREPPSFGARLRHSGGLCRLTHRNGRSAAHPDPLRRSPVAPPAHSRHHDRRTLASAG